MLRLGRPVIIRGLRTFFNDGYRDNASLEMVYRLVVKTSPVVDKLLEFYAKNLDAASLDNLNSLASSNTTVCVPLQPFLGDPHRVLLAFSLLPNKVAVESDGNIIVEAKIGDEAQRIKIVDHELISFIAGEILKKLGMQPTPEAARTYIDSMMDGAEAIAQRLYSTNPIEPSPLEKAMAEIDKETLPLNELKNLEKNDDIDILKWKFLPNPTTGKIEGKFKYFSS
jgi:hypothetical protein